MHYINLNLLPITLDEDITFPESYYENTSIKKMDNFHVTGVIKYNLSEEVEISLHVTGNIYLEDAITLEEVLYPIAIDIDENLSDLDGENDKFFEKNLFSLFHILFTMYLILFFPAIQQKSANLCKILKKTTAKDHNGRNVKRKIQFFSQIHKAHGQNGIANKAGQKDV